MGLPAQPASEADLIVAAYLTRTAGDPGAALRMVVRDALADLCEIERRTAARARLISCERAGRSFVQGLIPAIHSPS